MATSDHLKQSRFADSVHQDDTTTSSSSSSSSHGEKPVSLSVEEDVTTVLTTSSSTVSLSPCPPQYHEGSVSLSAEAHQLLHSRAGFLHEHDRHEAAKVNSGEGEEHLESPYTSLLKATTTDSQDPRCSISSASSTPSSSSSVQAPHSLRPSRSLRSSCGFHASYKSTKFLEYVSQKIMPTQYDPHSASTWIGFWALFNVTCANYVLSPMRDAIALAVGVKHMPSLTLASTLLAVVSSVPIGWLFEAPDPKRRKLWKRMGLTRGETQGTSLALFYRCFALSLMSYAVGFKGVKMFHHYMAAGARDDAQTTTTTTDNAVVDEGETGEGWGLALFVTLGKVIYIAFFLVVHLMKLHSLSLVWGVATEAMEYEDVARKQKELVGVSPKTRLQRLAFIGFGGTLGGLLGSVIASSMAQVLSLSGLLLISTFLLEIGSELAIELGRIMQRYWEEQQLFQSSSDLASLDLSMRRSSSLGSMKRVASGNSLQRAKSFSELRSKQSSGAPGLPRRSHSATNDENAQVPDQAAMKDNTFSERLLRGVTTILRSRLLMAIFTYNALYASTSVLLSFQRAALVANRSGATTATTAESDTAFLARINMASSVAVFVLQATGAGAAIAQAFGSRGTLALMPVVRLLGVMGLAWWHHSSDGQPPNLLLFLLLDECTRVMNLAVAKPVRESLWRGLSNEARYEAKPIVDTLANRWGGGSAAFLVSLMDKLLQVTGIGSVQEHGSRTVFGFPPILFLCVLISAWWAMVSADVGHIRRRIDLELKKRQ